MKFDYYMNVKRALAVALATSVVATQAAVPAVAMTAEKQLEEKVEAQDIAVLLEGQDLEAVSTQVLSSSLSVFAVNNVEDFLVTKNAVPTPTVDVWHNSTTSGWAQLKSSQYTTSITYPDSNAGLMTVKVTGTGDYAGKLGEIQYKLWADLALGTATINADGKDSSSKLTNPYTYTGSVINPTFTSFKLAGAEHTDIKVNYHTASSTDAGEYWIQIAPGSSGYSYGEQWIAYNITPAAISTATIDWGDALAQKYTGSAVTPKPVSVKLGDKVLTENVDYWLEYKNNTMIGTGTVTVNGFGNFTGSVTGSITIEADATKNYFEKAVMPTITDPIFTGKTYTASSFTGDVWLETEAGDWIVLNPKTDYTVEILNTSYTETDDQKTYAGTPGAHEWVITGIGSYAGGVSTAKTTFGIWADLASAKVTMSNDEYTTTATSFEATGSDVKPNGIVTWSSFSLKDAFASTYIGDTKNVGEVWLGLTPSTANPYLYGEAWASYKIIEPTSVPDALKLDEAFNAIDAQTFTGVQCTPTVVPKSSDLVEGVNYSVAYGTNIASGDGAGTATVTGLGIYAGNTVELKFNITAATGNKFANGIVEGVDADQYFDGTKWADSKFTPEFWIEATAGNWIIADASNYEVTFKHVDTTDDATVTFGTPGEYTMTITGKADGYGTDSKIEHKFTVWGDLSAMTMKFKANADAAYATEFPWTGSEVKPLVYLEKGDFTGDDAISAGFVTSYYDGTSNMTTQGDVWVSATATTSNGFYGELWQTYDIGAPSSESTTIEIAFKDDLDAGVTFTGSQITPEISITATAATAAQYNLSAGQSFTEGVDYTVTYGDNTKVGDNAGTVKITGLGAFQTALTKELTFDIIDSTANMFSEDKFSITIPVQEFAGKQITVADMGLDPWVELADGSWLQLTSDYVDITLTTADGVKGDDGYPDGGYTGKNKLVISGKENSGFGTASTLDITFDIWANLASCGGEFFIAGVGEEADDKGTVNADTKLQGFNYTGSALKPEVTLSINNTTFDYDEYTLTYYPSNTTDTGSDPVNTGDVWVQVTPKDTSSLLYGELWLQYDILAKSVEDGDVAITDIDPQKFVGYGIEPEVEVKDKETVLTKDTHYTVEYKDNVAVSNDTATVTITGIGQYAGVTATKTFNIGANDGDLFGSKVVFPQMEAYIYDGSTVYDDSFVKPEIWLELGNSEWTTLTAGDGKDYTVEVVNSTKETTSGEATETSISMGGVANISIMAIDDEATVDYAGTPGLQTYTITGTDEVGYGVTSSAEVTYEVWGDLANTTIKFYDSEGDDRKEITTLPASGEDLSIVAEVTYTTTDGTFVVPAEDYTLGGDDVSVEPGDIWISVKPSSGNPYYYGENWAKIAVDSNDLGAEGVVTVVTFDDDNHYFTAEEVEPTFEVTYQGVGVAEDDAVTLVEGDDYTVTFSNNVNVAGADAEVAPTVVITGIGNYTGEFKQKFAIELADELAFTIDTVETQIFTGEEIKPTPEVSVTLSQYNVQELVEGVDFAYSYASNTAIGEDDATITITGLGNYAGIDADSDTTFVIAGDLSQATVVFTDLETDADPDFQYTGENIVPDISVFIPGITDAIAEDDITVTYSDNKYLGTATITVTAATDVVTYVNDAEFYFNVVGADISAAVLENDIEAQAYTGDYAEPAIAAGELTLTVDGEEVTLKEYYDYELTWVNNVEVGASNLEVDTNPYILVTGIDSYTGTLKIPFEIKAGEDKTLFDYATVYVGEASFSGAAVTPEVWVIIEDPITGADITLVEGEDFKLGKYDGEDFSADDAYENNTSVGEGTVNIAGIGKYLYSSTSEVFDITASLEHAIVTFDDVDEDTKDEYTFVAGAIDFGATLSFDNGDDEVDNETVDADDYVLSFTNAAGVAVAEEDLVNVGTYTAWFVAESYSDYSGFVSAEFKIVEADVSTFGDDLTIVGGSYAYTGSTVEPTDLAVTWDGTELVLDQDFTIAYAEDANRVGGVDETTVTFTLTGMGNYTGSVADASYTIEAPDTDDLEAAIIMGDIDFQVFEGVAVTPTTILYMVIEGEYVDITTNFTAEYEENDAAGVGTLIYKGNDGTVYAGCEVSGEFDIWADLSKTALDVVTETDGSLGVLISFKDASGTVLAYAPETAFTLTGGSVDMSTSTIWFGATAVATEYYYGEVWGSVGFGVSTPPAAESEDAGE